MYQEWQEGKGHVTSFWIWLLLHRSLELQKNWRDSHGQVENYERFGVRGPDIIPEVFGVSPLILIGIVWGRWPHEERKGAEKSLLQPRCSISEWQNWQKTYIFLTYYHSVCLVYPFRIIKRNLCPVVVNKIMKNLLFINYLCWNLFELSCDLYQKSFSFFELACLFK